MSAFLATKGDLEISLIPEAEKLKAEALAECKSIVKVSDDFTQQISVDALKGVKKILNDLEKSRKDAKAPALAFGKRVDEVAKKFSIELESEFGRINLMIAAYEGEKRRLAEIEERKRQEAQMKEMQETRKRMEEEAKKVREAEEKLKAAKDFAALADAENELRRKKEDQRIAWEAEQERLRLLPKMQGVEKTEGQVVREVYTFTVQDIHALYAHDKTLVRMEPNVSAINVRIGAGDRVIPGIIIQKEIKTSVRV